VTLRLSWTEDDHVRLEVTDPDPHASLVLRHSPTDDETGRGLILLDAVALRWGVDRAPDGKAMWCECAL